MAEDQTAGTPEPEGGDAAATQTTGTPGTDDRNADTTKIDGTISKEEALGWKAKAERTNELEARLAAIEAERATPAAHEAGQEESNWDEIETAAAAGHKWAKAQLELRDEMILREKRDFDRRQLDDIAGKDTALRKQVAEHYLRNRTRFGDPDAAYSDLMRSRLEKERDDLREQLKREKATRPNPDTPVTHLREVSANENAQRMTNAEYRAKIDALDAREAQGDPSAAKERMRIKTLRNKGDILVDR